MDNPDSVEIAERVLHGLLDVIAPATCIRNPHDVLVCQRRLVALAFALGRDGFTHSSGAEIARAYGVTKQALNLDMKILQRAFQISFPTSHRGAHGRTPSWVRDV